MPSNKLNGLAEILREMQKKKAGVDYSKIYKEWEDEIASLYGQISSWLSPLTKDKLVNFEEYPTTLREDILGEYSITCLRITLANGVTISIEPVGRFILGAQGRVDISNGSRKYVLLRFKSGEWKFQLRKGIGFRSQLVPLSEESLISVIEDLIS